jgi:hypothetical protein
MISLNKLVGQESADRMRQAGLHKLAATRLRSEGIPVSDEFDLRDAVQALGTKLYTKNAEYRDILDGIQSLRILAGE